MCRRGLLLVLALVAACSGPEPRVAWEEDGAPGRSLAAAEVRDAVPRPDPLLDAGNTSPYVIDGVEYRVLASAAGYREEGIASWYGTKFHGQRTANGEIYDVYQPTAAHRSLPIPSYVRVTHRGNGRSIVVTGDLPTRIASLISVTRRRCAWAWCRPARRRCMSR